MNFDETNVTENDLAGNSEMGAAEVLSELVSNDEPKKTEKSENVSEKKEAKNEEKKEVSSDDDEKKIRYDESGIDERVLRAVTEMGFEYMSPIQEAAIPVMMDGKDIIGQAQTGTGKTAAFGIPLVQKVDPTDRSLQAIVLCPTRELAMQAADDVRDFSKYMAGVKVLPVYGGQDISRQIRALSSGVQIVIGTPGRVMDHMRRHTMKMTNVKILVLDEADEMLDMGFREDIETILQGMPEERQTALFSATMPKPILDITNKYQHDAKYIRMTPKEITVASIDQAYYRIPRKNKEEVLARLMDCYQPARSLIFCNTKRMVDELSEHLKDRGYLAEGLHGDLSQNQRDTVMNLFRNGRINILIATDVAARGIDVSNVEAVFNYDIPDDIEYYVHRIGRTGRAGKSGKSFTLVTGREMYKLCEIEKICHTHIEERKVPSAKEVTKAKCHKIFGEVIDIIENGDIDSTLEFVNKKVDEGEYTAEQLAAGFMKLKMGADIEELVLDEPRDRNRDSYRGRGSRDSRGGRRDGRGSYGRRDGSDRDGRGSYGRRDSSDRDGRGSYGKRDNADRDGRGSYGKRDNADRDGRSSFAKKDGFEKDRRNSYRGKSDSDERRDGDRNQDRSRRRSSGYDDKAPKKFFGKDSDNKEFKREYKAGRKDDGYKSDKPKKKGVSFTEVSDKVFGSISKRNEYEKYKSEKDSRSNDGSRPPKRKRHDHSDQTSFSAPFDRVQIKTKSSDGKFY